MQIHYEETVMNKDQVKGRIEKAKGKVKEATGKIVGNKSLEQKGKIGKALGRVQAAYGDLKDDLKKGN
jgi:uncharacterized protein YjbJ (UPF0337 family)